MWDEEQRPALKTVDWEKEGGVIGVEGQGGCERSALVGKCQLRQVSKEARRSGRLRRGSR